jgi:hypothetical protein
MAVTGVGSGNREKGMGHSFPAGNTGKEAGTNVGVSRSHKGQSLVFPPLRDRIVRRYRPTGKQQPHWGGHPT